MVVSCELTAVSGLFTLRQCEIEDVMTVTSLASHSSEEIPGLGSQTFNISLDGGRHSGNTGHTMPHHRHHGINGSVLW